MKNLPDLFRHNPFFQEMERLLERQALAVPAFTPSCDVDETDKEYKLHFDLPGVKKDDIKVDLHEGVLTVSGERRDEREQKSKGALRSERFYGSFSRSFAMPATLRAEQIEAEFSDGVLRLKVPKSEQSRKQQIKINEPKNGSQSKRPNEKVA